MADNEPDVDAVRVIKDVRIDYISADRETIWSQPIKSDLPKNVPVTLNLNGESIGTAVLTEVTNGLVVDIKLDVGHSDKARQVWQSIKGDMSFQPCRSHSTDTSTS